MAGRQLASKWLKTEALLTDPQIVPYIPATAAYGGDELMSMLSEHGMVVIKPVVGTGGNGVIRIEHKEDGGFLVNHKGRTRHAENMQDLLRMLGGMKLKRRYLIQQGIELAKIHGRPLDYRVKVVKIQRKWEFRAMVGRLARPGLFVTNLCKGGRLLRCRPALRMSLPHIPTIEKQREMRELTRNCIAVLEKKFPGISQLGFDYGLDEAGQIWILEVNTRPG